MNHWKHWLSWLPFYADLLAVALLLLAVLLS
jgi:hypothetical protein